MNYTKPITPNFLIAASIISFAFNKVIAGIILIITIIKNTNYSDSLIVSYI